MPAPIKGDNYKTQDYGLTPYAKSAAGKAAYKNFPGGIHPGKDFGTHGKHLPAISTCAGQVVAAGVNGGWGNMVEVLGPDGWRRQYAHLHEIHVKAGENVKIGTELGLVGTTGSSTGIHLHYGHRRWSGIRWQYRDPEFELVMAEEFKMEPGLVKANLASLPRIFFYNGQSKFHIPDMETLRTLWPSDDWQLVDAGCLEKVPEHDPIPSLKVV